MHDSLRRMIGAAGILLGIALAFWIFFGAPNGWSGDMRYVRFAIGLCAYGLIHGGVTWIFPDRPGDSEPSARDGKTA
ncbi:hypothetical protein N0X72_13785 [Streptomyces carpaticus]|uniref:Uncharacterized protein n=2 Tax=Streptomyces TaxID=1883 RepID=A0A1I6T9L9_9ACTN|nr:MULTISPECIES: hypothetical protein [Streptomyces]QKV69596.1 hypothetical protein HUT13_12995 [Streptomyces harbinensis]UWM49999.1 hypothetical protein N0X72_13785 [Streptomyces carpaticus]SFS85880.1 hypothetical protein SAMN05444716_104492 [Streptomyces harbinensis]